MVDIMKLYENAFESYRGDVRVYQTNNHGVLFTDNKNNLFFHPTLEIPGRGFSITLPIRHERDRTLRQLEVGETYHKMFGHGDGIDFQIQGGGEIEGVKVIDTQTTLHLVRAYLDGQNEYREAVQAVSRPIDERITEMNRKISELEAEKKAKVDLIKHAPSLETLAVPFF